MEAPFRLSPARNCPKPQPHRNDSKTATAQSGVYENGVEKLNTWYSGFFPAQEPQYVLTVLCEDGSSGAQDCTPVFEQIAQAILQ